MYNSKWKKEDERTNEFMLYSNFLDVWKNTIYNVFCNFKLN
jgi:hypothetical protein